MNNNGRQSWTDERLDRLASAVEVNKDSISDLRASAELLLQTVNQHQQNFEVLVQEIRGIRTEITGLRVENRHILDHLFNEQEGD